MIRKLAIAILASALVAGCGKKAPEVPKSQKAQGGEVIPGTISDAMIDLSTSQAQAPLAPRKANSGRKPAVRSNVAASESAAAPSPSPSASATPAAN